MLHEQSQELGGKNEWFVSGEFSFIPLKPREMMASMVGGRCRGDIASQRHGKHKR